MTKNIILTSDGTGNKGGYGADTNVFKTYLAVDLHHPEITQVAFHDDGVGTNKNKYIRGITGAFGIGLTDNVKEIYTFLCRNYEKDSKIFLFGFSRGAATVRTLAGFILACGIIDGKAYPHDRNLKAEVDKAMAAYQTKKGAAFQEKLKKDEKGFTNVEIEFIGVWDTVSALGIPKKWPKSIQWIADGLSAVADGIAPHKFHDYQLNNQVKNVFHALAMDDERKTFHPEIWNEKNTERRPENIEQVWFSGVHSNVGGGYPKCGLSNVALDWMMTKAENLDLEFHKSLRTEAKISCNVNDKLYDSRDGAAIYYRYAPRNIEALCQKKLEGPIRIHESVFDRLKRSTADYAPGFIPQTFSVVDNDGVVEVKKGEITVDLGNASQPRAQIDASVLQRKQLYETFAIMTLIVAPPAVFFWFFPEKLSLAPIQVAAFALLIALLFWPLNILKKKYRASTLEGSENLRAIVVKEV